MAAVGNVSCTELTVYVLSKETLHQGVVSVVAACQDVVVSPSFPSLAVPALLLASVGRFKARVWLVPALPPLV